MLRALLYGLAILHLGPGIAFALLAFGCEGANPYLGAICGRNIFSLFALLTAGGWLILSLGLVAMHLLRRARGSVPPRIALRVWALLAVLAVGALMAASGAWLTGSQYWFLAIPASLAVGWLYLANPVACQPETPASCSQPGSHKSAA
jgi:hypothetical protein